LLASLPKQCADGQFLRSEKDVSIGDGINEARNWSPASKWSIENHVGTVENDRIATGDEMRIQSSYIDILNDNSVVAENNATNLAPESIGAAVSDDNFCFEVMVMPSMPALSHVKLGIVGAFGS
jgi:hypothetical protein